MSRVRRAPPRQGPYHSSSCKDVRLTSSVGPLAPWTLLRPHLIRQPYRGSSWAAKHRPFAWFSSGCACPIVSYYPGNLRDGCRGAYSGDQPTTLRHWPILIRQIVVKKVALTYFVILVLIFGFLTICTLLFFSLPLQKLILLHLLSFKSGKLLLDLGQIELLLSLCHQYLFLI